MLLFRNALSEYADVFTVILVGIVILAYLRLDWVFLKLADPKKAKKKKKDDEKDV